MVVLGLHNLGVTVKSGGAFGSKVVGHNVTMGWLNGVVWWMEVVNISSLLMTARRLGDVLGWLM